MEITNAKNTICNFKRLLGRRYQDTYVQQEKELNAYSIVEGKNGSVNIEVNKTISLLKKKRINISGELS
jgi:molecular chaperone DnaK (HSP70)